MKSPRETDSAFSEAIARGYETRDARPRTLLLLAISLIAGILLVHFMGWRFLAHLNDAQQADDAAHHAANPFAPPIAIPPEPNVQPEPGRQELPAQELARVRAEENGLIGASAHGWVDPAHQFIRVPLQQAIDIAVADGLPEKLPATQPSQPPSMPPASALHGPGGVP